MSAGLGAEAAISVTFFPNAAAQTKREEALDLPDLADRIATTTASSKVTLPWLKLATFGDLRTADKNSLRHNANVVTISGVEADYDAETAGSRPANRRKIATGNSSSRSPDCRRSSPPTRSRA